MNKVEKRDCKIDNKKKNHTKKNTKSGKRNQSPEIMGVMYFFVTLFLVMICYIGYFVYSDREKLINNSYNPRQAIIAEQNIRGTIFSRDMDILAETKTSKSGKEKRIYPYNELFSHAIGFSSNGRLGVEASANYYLITSDITVDEKVKNELSGVKNPADNVITTLDVDIQQAAYDALGAYKGAIIAMEPDTGKILAMVSKPDFDPNEISTIWEDIINDKTSTVLLNRATQGLYPPGSTFKIITALEFMRENPDTFQNYQYTCNGKFKLEDSTIQCYHGSVHGSVDLTQSFAKSCNSSFANIGTSLHYGDFEKTLSQLLFNQALPVDFAYKKSSIGVTADTTNVDMMQMAIGQGATQMSPLHLAMITSSVANDGILMKPYIIDEITNGKNINVKKNTTEKYGTLMSAEEAAELKTLMEAVIESGTGTKLSGLSYTAAGKTGSAEYNAVKEDSHAWFTGFAPVKNPKIVVTVILEGAGSGGDYAVPIAKRVFDAYFKE
ncbi:MAG: penicillin-binding transpeptidase domain-containing protein [Lachnospiraceae bacterium]|nr:penicillin-binding transpeptidase domain-containing protein [Lachnospiraceae bacterium]